MIGRFDVELVQNTADECNRLQDADIRREARDISALVDVTASDVDRHDKAILVGRSVGCTELVAQGRRDGLERVGISPIEPVALLEAQNNIACDGATVEQVVLIVDNVVGPAVNPLLALD